MSSSILLSLSSILARPNPNDNVSPLSCIFVVYARRPCCTACVDPVQRHMDLVSHPKRRIALIGDAAHPFLPTSIQGASQAMEDGATMAVCLSKGGKSNVQQAVAAFEGLRYERVRAAQKTGEKTRDTWHKANWEEAKKNPESMKLKREEWLLNFDAEEYAEKNYAATVALLNDTVAVRELNIPFPSEVLASA